MIVFIMMSWFSINFSWGDPPADNSEGILGYTVTYVDDLVLTTSWGYHQPVKRRCRATQSIMPQLMSYRALIGFIAVAVAAIALFGASPLEVFSSRLQKAGIDWYRTQTNMTVSSATSATRTPVYFFSHGGVSLSLWCSNRLTNKLEARCSV